MKKTAVLGFGNPVRSDDAVGIFVIEKLQEQLGTQENVTFFDMGSSAFELLFKLRGHERFIIVDAVINSGEKPGTLFKLPASAIQGSIQDDPLVFLHSLKWDQALSYAKKMMGDSFPEDITVFLIAVDDTRLEIGMSEEVTEAGVKVAEKIIQEVCPNPDFA
ncbi:MAG: hydrogenase maturation protease [Bacteroidota bacterium]